MISISGYGTLVAASLVLLFGRVLVEKTAPLKAFTIPEPVAGGLVVALLMLFAQQVAGVTIKFDTSLQTPLMLAFFATIGLSANLATLKAGGNVMLKFLGVVLGLLVMQNVIGISLASLLGLERHLGLLAGSVTLSGGHGTGAAWSSVFSEQFGIQGATELAMACATFGLVLGGLIGGPVAKYLIRKVTIPSASHHQDQAPVGFEEPQATRLITVNSFIESLALIALSLAGGQMLAEAIAGTSFELPTFVCVLFIGVLLRNVLSGLGWYQVFEREISVLGNVSLALFLAMALMSLRLWELAHLALPILLILSIQAVAMAVYAIVITFRVMGKNYDAAVLAAGHCGFGLGATPTAIANMQAVTHRFGPSHLAFIVVPMVGAFFIDIANALVIKLFMALPIY
ncbi:MULTISPECIES: sodium/glutamate symporter [Deefgea]|uniref:Sodium/glutamate symporter n=1 Tax=Deefgea chitinilytica TaxID=570276 RepID=A0ABS2C812_9NEIS|nr:MULTISPECIES: sodium/glutamate symporter [Deefgea]MBM5570298.1 sodium/glutamate symporter [Deefgea chitinilytica]MBM9887527.1 sodium/glutamate symporter [Deefgea sp. CFH1-16]